MLLVKANRNFSAWIDETRKHAILIKLNDYLLISQEVSCFKGRMFIVCYLLSQKTKIDISAGKFFLDYVEGLNPEGSEKLNEFKQMLYRKNNELFFS